MTALPVAYYLKELSGEPSRRGRGAGFAGALHEPLGLEGAVLTGEEHLALRLAGRPVDRCPLARLERGVAAAHPRVGGPVEADGGRGAARGGGAGKDALERVHHQAGLVLGRAGAHGEPLAPSGEVGEDARRARLQAAGLPGGLVRQVGHRAAVGAMHRAPRPRLEADHQLGIGAIAHGVDGEALGRRQRHVEAHLAQHREGQGEQHARGRQVARARPVAHAAHERAVAAPPQRLDHRVGHHPVTQAIGERPRDPVVAPADVVTLVAVAEDGEVVGGRRDPQQQVQGRLLVDFEAVLGGVGHVEQVAEPARQRLAFQVLGDRRPIERLGPQGSPVGDRRRLAKGREIARDARCQRGERFQDLALGAHGSAEVVRLGGDVAVGLGEVVQRNVEFGGQRPDGGVRGVDQLAAEFHHLVVGEPPAQAQHPPARAGLRVVHPHVDAGLREAVGGGEAGQARADHQHGRLGGGRLRCHSRRGDGTRAGPREAGAGERARLEEEAPARERPGTGFVPHVPGGRVQRIGPTRDGAGAAEEAEEGGACHGWSATAGRAVSAMEAGNRN